MRIDTPVVFIIFNRPDCTARVFEQIRSAEPGKLHIVADGARINVIGEQEKVNRCRDIVSQITWDCEVIRHYSEINLGCRDRIHSGLNAVFDREEKAIILEDDCLPDRTFFSFCAELLERFKDESQIMHIGGNNFIGADYSQPYSYHFSRYTHVWGWATWKRAWNCMDLHMRKWPKKKKAVTSVCSFKKERRYWAKRFDNQYSVPEQINAWDYSWMYSCWLHKGIAIYPSVNLVQNIGFGDAATHTSEGQLSLSIPSQSMHSILHPQKIIINTSADKENFKKHFLHYYESSFSKFISRVRIRFGIMKRKVITFFLKRL